MKRVIIALVRGYQKYISPHTPPKCRFYPTCSHYMIEAVEVHGAWKGFWMGVWRILRCNPFGKSGFDPVPPKQPKQMRAQKQDKTH